MVPTVTSSPTRLAGHTQAGLQRKPGQIVRYHPYFRIFRYIQQSPADQQNELRRRLRASSRHTPQCTLPPYTTVHASTHFAEEIDVQHHQHWRPASCIRATNIPYSQLISLVKLRTNSHHLDIERMRHVRPRVPRSRRACPWCRTPGALHDELHCTLECPHLSNTRLQYPALFGAGQVGTNMRTLFTAEHLAAPMASFVHSFPANTDDEPGTAITLP